MLVDTDAFCCVVVPVTAGGALGERWSQGPLPVSLPVETARGRSGGSTVADREARSNYFAPRVVSTLYSSDAVRSTGRWHAFAENVVFQGASVVGWEVLIVAQEGDEPFGYAVAHLKLPDAHLRFLAQINKHESEERGWLESAFPAGVRVVPRSRFGLVSHLAFSGTVLPEPDDRAKVLAATRGWDAADRWCWFLGAGVDADSFLPDAAAPRPGTTLYLSSDWRGLALRSGIAYCALTPKSQAPHDLLRAYVRSIHLDGFLLCQLQADAVESLADKLGQTSLDDLAVETAMVLEEQLLCLRGALWWRHVSRRGSQVDQVVRALQDERALPDLYQQLVSELTDVSRFIQLRQAAADQDRDRKLGQIVSLASAAFVTPSVFLAAVALVPEPSTLLQVVFWGSSALLAVGTWFAVRAWIRRTQE